jgi:hypothetical protein
MAIEQKVNSQSGQPNFDMKKVLTDAIEKHLSQYEQLVKTAPEEDHTVYLEVARNMIKSAEKLHADVRAYKKRIAKYDV